ncbi:hypothetical protein [Glutamicibacter endophyticus]|uniref:hypothetical protein n=1 Tax=Glutamicibacter endophyticus TaxID=1522174 RepID=UPI003AF1D507
MATTILFKGGPWAEKTMPNNLATIATINQFNAGNYAGCYEENTHAGTFHFDGVPARVFVWVVRQ